MFPTGIEGEPCDPKQCLIKELAELLDEYAESMDPVEMAVILQMFVKTTEGFIPKDDN